MAFLFSSKILLLALSYFTIIKTELTFSEAKNQLINHYKAHHAEQDLGVKTASFEISENGFIRYKKTFSNNKTEYYSAKLTQFEGMSYLGNEDAGWLVLKFNEETIIYQTYNDKEGNVDEMVSQIKIPLKNMNLTTIDTFDKTMITLKKLAFNFVNGLDKNF